MKYLILFSMAILFLGCNKVKSKKWLVADIHVTDIHTGQDIPCSFRLSYTVSTFLGSYQEELDLGNSDANGVKIIEQEISKKYTGFKLHINAHDPYYGIPPYDMENKTISLSATSNNTNNVQIASNSYYTLSVKNLNCAGPTDSVFISSNLSDDVDWTLAGCVDTTLTYSLGYTGFSFDPLMTLKYVVKRGSTIDSLEQDFQLTPREIVPIQLNY